MRISTRASMRTAIAALIPLAGATLGWGQTIAKANIPFEFQAGGKTLPAGVYDFRVDFDQEALVIEGRQSVVVPFITTLAKPVHTQATDSHLVFDKTGDTYALSEVWQAGGNGFLIHATKGPHEHHVLHFRHT